MDSHANYSSFINDLSHTLEKEKSSNHLILQVSISQNVNFETPYVKAKEIIPRIIDAIKSAENEVLICGYKIDRDCDGEQELIQALQTLSDKAKQQGKHIRVRIMINRREGIAAYFKPNAATESKLREMEFDALDYQYVEHSHGAFGSYHAKQYLIDYQVAILCSGDITRRNNYKKQYDGFTEVATVIYGPDFVSMIRFDFINAWNSEYCNPINTNNKKKSIPNTLTSNDHDYQSDDSMEELSYINKIKLTPRDTVYDRHFINQEPVSAIYFAKAESSDLTRRYCSPYKIAVIEAIKAAHSQIDIMTPNLNDPDVINELVRAITRGVLVRIVIGKHMNDSSESKPYMGGTNYENINSLLEKIPASPNNDYTSNIQIHFAASAGKTIPEEHPNALHAKFICVDEAIVIVGSSVLDMQSIYHSREGDICFESPSVAKQYLSNLFNPAFNSGIDYYADKIFTLNKINEEKSNQHYKTACECFTQGNYESGVISLIEALKIHPLNKDAYLSLQMILIKQDPVIKLITKNTLYNGIKQLAIDDQIRLLYECMNENSKTLLSRRMWQQEGLFPCSINASTSTLGRMNKRLAKLAKIKQLANADSAKQTGPITSGNLFNSPQVPTSSETANNTPKDSKQKSTKK